MRDLGPREIGLASEVVGWGLRDVERHPVAGGSYFVAVPSGAGRAYKTVLVVR